MRPILLLAAIAMYLAGGTALAQTDGTVQSETSRLTLNVVGFNNDTGRAMIALANRRDQFLSRGQQPFRTAALLIQEKRARWVFEELPAGEYAISVFHDENNNGELDSNLFRIPEEAYGFSNDARGTFGPPDYAAASFRLDQPDQSITITVK